MESIAGFCLVFWLAYFSRFRRAGSVGWHRDFTGSGIVDDDRPAVPYLGWAITSQLDIIS